MPGRSRVPRLLQQVTCFLGSDGAGDGATGGLASSVSGAVIAPRLFGLWEELPSCPVSPLSLHLCPRSPQLLVPPFPPPSVTWRLLLWKPSLKEQPPWPRPVYLLLLGARLGPLAPACWKTWLRKRRVWGLGGVSFPLQRAHQPRQHPRDTARVQSWNPQTVWICLPPRALPWDFLGGTEQVFRAY